MKTIILALLFGSLTVSLAHAAGSEAVANFNTLVDRYFDFYFSFYPSDATADGLHQYDSKLEDYSAAARQKEIAGLKDFLAKFEAIKSTNFPADAGADLQWIISSIHSNLLELENVQMWRKDPDHYTAGVTNSIFVIMKRNYAPADQRLRAAIDRELQIPKALAVARQNLQNPPKIYSEIALQQLPDDTDFFRNDVPEAFSSVTEPKLLADFKAANQSVIHAFESYEKYLHDSVLPHASGDFRLGAEN